MKLFKDLIFAKSYDGNYNEIIKVISEYIIENTDGELILQPIDENKSNIIVKFGEPKLLINCHMDTVAPVSSWSLDPFNLTIEDNRYFGLGACDTKGSIYSVLKALKESKPKDLMLLFSVDEESGDKTGVHTFLDSDYAKSITKAIVCEPTELKFVNRHKGYFSFWITHIAIAGHSSIKRKSAIVKAAEAIIKFDENEFNIGKIDGGTATNVVSDVCKYKVSIRNYENHQDVLQKVNVLAGGAEVKTSFVGNYLLNEEPFLNEMLFSKNNITEEYNEVSFWTEGALFQSANINTVVFGPGSINEAHSKNEFVEKSQIEEAIKIFKNIIEGV